MAKEFTLEGEVGWDVDAWTVKRILSQAGGEDITVRFSSPGGSVFAGITIFNLFKAYAGKVTFHIIGLAASMGSYIPLAADKITAEPNSVFMIHNARSFVAGDQNAMRKRADLVEGLSKILAKEYAKRTGKTEIEIQAMMDAETFLFGAQMVDEGFVDSLSGEPDSDPDAQAIHTALAKESFEAVVAKLRDEKPDDYEQAAALIDVTESNAGSLLTDIKKPVIQGRDNQKTEGNSIMDEKELKAKHPEIAAALIAEGHAKGVTDERDRVNAHLIRGNASGDTKTAFTAIEDGSAMTETVKAKYAAASMNKRDIENRLDEDGNIIKAIDGAVIEAGEETDAEKIAAGLEKKFGVKKK